VIEALSPHVRVSIDTGKRRVAEAAIDAGATLVNDLTASLYEVAAQGGAGWAGYHVQGTPRTMQDAPQYDDVVAEVRNYLVDAARRAGDAGVAEIWIDPGLGFGKTADHNLSLLRHLRVLVETDFAVLIGASRKSFLGRLTGGAPIDDRVEASVAAATWALAQGAGMVRAHDVGPTVEAARLVAAA
jgi:dihydropteroate synthase